MSLKKVFIFENAEDDIVQSARINHDIEMITDAISESNIVALFFDEHENLIEATFKAPVCRMRFILFEAMKEDYIDDDGNEIKGLVFAPFENVSDISNGVERGGEYDAFDRTITLYFQDRRDLNREPKDWARFLIDNRSTIIGNYEQILYHELVHLYRYEDFYEKRRDVHSANDNVPKWIRKRDAQTKHDNSTDTLTYKNSPVEMEAYHKEAIQTALAIAKKYRLDFKSPQHFAAFVVTNAVQFSVDTDQKRRTLMKRAALYYRASN